MNSVISRPAHHARSLTAPLWTIKQTFSRRVGPRSWHFTRFTSGFFGNIWRKNDRHVSSQLRPKVADSFNCQSVRWPARCLAVTCNSNTKHKLIFLISQQKIHNDKVPVLLHKTEFQINGFQNIFFFAEKVDGASHRLIWWLCTACFYKSQCFRASFKVWETNAFSSVSVWNRLFR